MAKTVGVVDNVVFGHPPEHGLAELAGPGLSAVPAGPDVGGHLSGNLGQTEGITEFPEREQTDIGGEFGAMEF
jgi:hypothetical protein